MVTSVPVFPAPSVSRQEETTSHWLLYTLRGKESRRCCLEAVSSLLLSVSATSFAWPTHHQLRSCNKKSSSEPNQHQFTQQWNLLLTWTGVFFYLKLYVHHALQATTLLLILSSWARREKETTAFPCRQAECPCFFQKTGWGQQDCALSWAPVWIPRQPRSVPLFRTTPSLYLGIRYGQRLLQIQRYITLSMPTGHRVRVALLLAETLPPQLQEVLRCWQHLPWARWLTVSGSLSWSPTSPSLTSHHSAAGLAHAFPVLYTNTTDLPLVLSSASWKQTPLSAEEQGQCCRREKVPYLFWRCCRNSCNPPARMSDTHSHLSPSRRAATTAVCVWLSITCTSICPVSSLSLGIICLNSERQVNQKNRASWKIPMKTFI